MINYLSNKILNILIVIFLGAQCLIFFLNQKPLTKNFSQKNITVENFSSIVLSWNFLLVSSPQSDQDKILETGIEASGDLTHTIIYPDCRSGHLPAGGESSGRGIDLLADLTQTRSRLGPERPSRPGVS